MAIVSLEGMRFYAFHGFYDFERRIGNNYIVDVHVDVDLQIPPDDKIDNTVNYENIYAIVARHMEKNYQLLESLAYQIGLETKSLDEKVKTVEIKLSKINPPIQGKVDKATVKLVV